MAITWYNPDMTAANRPLPFVASASSTHSHGSYQGWVAFKKDVATTSTGDCWVTAVNVTSGWLQLDFGTPTSVSDYQMRIRGYTGPNGGQYTGMPKNWTMLGSNDGVNFDLLDTQTNQSWTVASLWRGFSLGKAVRYRYYRINITANNGEPSGILLGKLQFGFDPAFQSKSVFKNVTNGKFYTVTDGIATELADGTNDTVSQQGIASGTKILMSTVPNLKSLIGLPFQIISYGASEIPLSVSVIENFTSRKTAQSYPVSLAGVDSIASINVVATGDVKHVLSVDGDITWKKFDGTSWVQVSDFADGNTTAELNAITAEQYKLLFNSQATITFGHSLAADSSITTVTLKVNLKGVTRLAPQTSYTQEFNQAEKTIVFNITKSGQYSINFVDSI